MDITTVDPMEVIVNDTGALVYVIDLKTHEILYANKRCKEEFGEVTGKICYKVFQHEQSKPCPFCPQYQNNKNPMTHPLGTIFEWENQNTLNQRYYTFVDRIIKWKNGQKAKVQIGIDITNQKKLEAEISHLRDYDSLTKLPNRLLFKELLHNMIQKLDSNFSHGALFFIDLDNFKIINDTKGHNVGDLVLIEVAKRIQNSLKDIEIFARLGGDEFVIALQRNQSDKNILLHDLSLKANKILELLQLPCTIKNFNFTLTASIGIVTFENAIHSVDELMKFADSTMYTAKENGGNNYCFFDPKLQRIIETKALLTERLRQAIASDKMYLHYQPQICLEDTERIIGVEALIRWHDADNGIVSPGSFIPIAEESGLIVPLGEYILREAMKQLKLWEKDTIKKEWRISINVSYKQFETDNFIELLESLIYTFQIDPSLLRLELTESLLIKNTDVALNKIKIIKKLGLTLSIDDFGTGYSSLSYLKQLPIDELKIDQSFIRDLVTDPNDYIIVETILSIGQKFNFEVIAEGVETQKQYELLSSMGCKNFQGYYFSKPMEESKLTTHFKLIH